ncbi:hypothetical protein [Rhodococcus ruber]|uniref:hypothetical protein n=1 Tax=Rhodococcus ruber TaxID=1830 RepID=UPI00034DDD3B|nr:hypothetical protein [Rhodococcus ruber]
MAGATLLTGYEVYLRERFAAGCTDAARLTQKITERGYRGSAQTVRRFLQPLRHGPCPAGATAYAEHQAGHDVIDVPSGRSR